MMKLVQQACSWLSLRHRPTLLQLSISVFSDVFKYTKGYTVYIQNRHSSSLTHLLTYPTLLKLYILWQAG